MEWELRERRETEFGSAFQYSGALYSHYYTRQLPETLSIRGSDEILSISVICMFVERFPGFVCILGSQMGNNGV